MRSAEETSAINRMLQSHGLGRLEDGAGLMSQLGYMVMDHEHLRSLLIRCEPENRSAMYDSASSQEMEPYLRLAMAQLQGADPGPELETLRRLPLEKRYVWRLASALKWAFADFDSANVKADREMLSAEDQAKVMDLLKHRPVQFCLFLKALLGPEEMKRVMIQAIAAAGKLP